MCLGLGGGNREEEVQDRDGAQCAVEFQRCAAWVCGHEVSTVLNVRVFAAEVLLVPTLGPSAHGLGGTAKKNDKKKQRVKKEHPLALRHDGYRLQCSHYTHQR